MPAGRRSGGCDQVCSAAHRPTPMCTGGRGVGLPTTVAVGRHREFGHEPAASDMRHTFSGARSRREHARGRGAAIVVAASGGGAGATVRRCPDRRRDTVDKALTMRWCLLVRPASLQFTTPFGRACTPSPVPCPVSRCVPPSEPCAGPVDTSCTGACYGSISSSAWPRAASSRTPSTEPRRFRDRVLTLRQSLTWILALTFAT